MSHISIISILFILGIITLVLVLPALIVAIFKTLLIIFGRIIGTCIKVAVGLLFLYGLWRLLNWLPDSRTVRLEKQRQELIHGR